MTYHILLCLHLHHGIALISDDRVYFSYRPTTLSRAQVTRGSRAKSPDIGQLVILDCKNTCSTSRLRELRFFICFAFIRLIRNAHKIKHLDDKLRIR